jgi:hypothetical protein
LFLPDLTELTDIPTWPEVSLCDFPVLFDNLLLRSLCAIFIPVKVWLVLLRGGNDVATLNFQLVADVLEDIQYPSSPRNEYCHTWDAFAGLCSQYRRRDASPRPELQQYYAEATVIVTISQIASAVPALTSIYPSLVDYPPQLFYLSSTANICRDRDTKEEGVPSL